MAEVSPALRIRCPYCWKEFHPGDCPIYSTLDPQRLIYAAPLPGTPEYDYSRKWIIDLKGPDLALELPVRRCPNPVCEKLLFEGIEECDNVNIAIVGDSSSGKTHYIALLIHQLERSILMQNGDGLVQLIPRNKQTNDDYKKNYFTPIIRDHESLVITQPGIYDHSGKPQRLEPLVYLLRIQDNNAHIDKRINLLLFDISGEDIVDETRLVGFGEHILRADGIIYLADPMSMEHIRQKIPADAQTSLVTGRPAQRTLEIVANRLEAFHNIKKGNKLHIPTAIVVSKSDLLQHVIPQQDRLNYWFFYGSYNDGKAHMEDIRHIDQDVRTILYQYGESGLLNIKNLFEHVSFFALSATGNPPDKLTNQYDEVKPNRCLDPFVWLLWKRRFLQAVR